MIPPDLAAMLGGGGAPAGQPPMPMMEEPPAEAAGDPADVLRQMLGLVDQYRQVEQDDEDLLQIEKISTQIQQLLANQQKDLDGLLQGKASPKVMRKYS